MKKQVPTGTRMEREHSILIFQLRCVDHQIRFIVGAVHIQNRVLSYFRIKNILLINQYVLEFRFCVHNVCDFHRFGQWFAQGKEWWSDY